VRKNSLLLLLIAFSVFAAASDQSQNTIKQKYRNLEVGAFTIEKGVDLPADYFAALPQEIVSQFQESKLFDRVSTAPTNVGQTTDPSLPASPVLRMTGVITAFHAGSRKGRYFGGAFNPGAQTQIYAYVQYVDAATNALIVENEVVGTLSSGFGGGNSKNVVREFAESLVDTTKFIVLKPPLSAADEPPRVPDDAARETVELSDSTFDATLSRVNDLASKGYRLLSFKTTSYKTANLVMAKAADTAQYQYAFFKAIMPGNIEKELNGKSLEGYRYRPHTMILLKDRTFVIAERDASASPAHYEYRLHATMRVGSAEKDIRNDQADGFVLVNCRNTSESHHMLLLEKKLEK
jgi:hypothetical protein